MSLAILGGVGLDVLVYPDGREESLIGGSAWYAALAAGLFCEVRLLAAVGGDFPASALEALRERGVALSDLQVHSAERSFCWKARYAENPDERVTLDLQPNVEGCFNPVLPQPCPDFVFLANCQPSLQAKLLRQLPAGVFVALDTIDRWIERRREELVAMLPRVDLFFINAQEAALLAGGAELEENGRTILGMGPRFCIVKDGASGSHLFSPAGHWFVPVRPAARVVDATGAGDTFAGALMGALARSGRTIDEAAICRAAAAGAAVASFKIEGPGASLLLDSKRSILRSCGLT